MNKVKSILNVIVTTLLLLGLYFTAHRVLDIKDSLNPRLPEKLMIEVDRSLDLLKMTIAKFITMEHLSTLLISIFFISVSALYMLRDDKTSNVLPPKN